MSGHHHGKAWDLVARACKERDGWRCRRCGAAGRLEAHHRVPVSEGGSDDLDNLLTLCRSCHIAHHRRPRSAAVQAWERLVAST